MSARHRKPERQQGAPLTAREAADVLRCKVGKVRQLVRRGELSYFRVGREILIGPDDLARFLEQCRRAARWERGGQALSRLKV